MVQTVSDQYSGKSASGGLFGALGSLGVSNLSLDFRSRVLWFDRIDFLNSLTRNTRVV